MVAVEWADVEQLLRAARESSLQLWYHLQELLANKRTFDAMPSLLMAVLRLSR